MRDLTSHRAALHIKTRRLKLLFVGGGGGGGSGGWLWICCGGAHTNVLAGRTLASCQILVIGAAEKVRLGGGKKNKTTVASIMSRGSVVKKSRLKLLLYFFSKPQSSCSVS